LDEPDDPLESEFYEEPFNLPITLFNYGYDVFIGSTVGTMYQDAVKEGIPDASTKEYW
jgi:hypothetical protein